MPLFRSHKTPETAGETQNHNKPAAPTSTQPAAPSSPDAPSVAAAAAAFDVAEAAAALEAAVVVVEFVAAPTVVPFALRVAPLARAAVVTPVLFMQFAAYWADVRVAVVKVMSAHFFLPRRG